MQLTHSVVYAVLVLFLVLRSVAEAEKTHQYYPHEEASHHPCWKSYQKVLLQIVLEF